MRQQIFIDEESGTVTGIGVVEQRAGATDFLPANANDQMISQAKADPIRDPEEFRSSGCIGSNCTDPSEFRPAQ